MPFHHLGLLVSLFGCFRLLVQFVLVVFVAWLIFRVPVVSSFRGVALPGRSIFTFALIESIGLTRFDSIPDALATEVVVLLLL